MITAPVIFVVGPTAVGKTALSIQLAKAYNAEIISADSRQIYKYMDIGTAKPSVTEQAGIKHHLLDVIMPDMNYNAGKFVADANDIIARLQANGKNVIVCGGTGLYIKSLIDGIVPLDFPVQPIRGELEKRLTTEGLADLYNTLAERDPVLAKKLNPNDRQRILRALEVVMATGTPLSEWHQIKPEPASFSYKMFGLEMERELLYQRINNRVDKMLEEGLVDEVKRLIEMGFSESNALNAVGYKEVLSYKAGDIDYEEMVELIKRNTRRFSKRQMTWFRKEKRIVWLNAKKNTINEMLDRILKTSH